MKTKFLPLHNVLGLFTTSCKEDYLVTAPTGSVDAAAAYATTNINLLPPSTVLTGQW